MAANTDRLKTNGGEEIDRAALTYLTEDRKAPAVYYTSEITPGAMVKAYQAMGWTPEGRVAVKVTTGEPPASNYLKPELIKDLVQLIDGTIVECNTAYGGSRSDTKRHYQVAKDHGFTDIAKVKILDEDGSLTLPVIGGAQLTENFVGKAFADFDSYLVLSHFKGHYDAGFGGAIKNISIGLASSEGKFWIHTGGAANDNFDDGTQEGFLKALSDAGKSVSDFLKNGERIAYVNVLNMLSIDCDCVGHPAPPDIPDIGIMASVDPVALDQASVDLVSVSRGREALMERIKSREGMLVLESGEKIGLGSRHYRLIDLD